MENFSVNVEQGKKRVKIVRDEYGLELYTMSNGQMWMGQHVDDELLDMISECIARFKNRSTDQG